MPGVLTGTGAQISAHSVGSVGQRKLQEAFNHRQVAGAVLHCNNALRLREAVPYR